MVSNSVLPEVSPQEKAPGITFLHQPRIIRLCIWIILGFSNNALRTLACNVLGPDVGEQFLFLVPFNGTHRALKHLSTWQKLNISQLN